MSSVASLRVRTVPADQRQSALRLVFRGLPEPEASAQVAEMGLSQVESEAAWQGLLGAYRGQDLVGALLAQVQPGRTAAVWPPQLSPGEPNATANVLVASAVEWLDAQDVQMAQSLLAGSDLPEGRSLTEGGFHHMADLLYLGCEDPALSAEPPPGPLRFEPHDAANHDRLVAIVEATYDRTCDCPQLNGIRTTDDVLTGYRSTGVFDPRLWLIVRHQDADVGCLLMADHPAHDVCELIYMGIVPGVRGRGWGMHVARHAQWITRQRARSRLVLAVDAANEPGIRMYAAVGFEAWDRRAVFLRLFPK